MLANKWDSPKVRDLFGQRITLNFFFSLSVAHKCWNRRKRTATGQATALLQQAGLNLCAFARHKLINLSTVLHVQFPKWNINEYWTLQAMSWGTYYGRNPDLAEKASTCIVNLKQIVNFVYRNTQRIQTVMNIMHGLRWIFDVNFWQSLFFNVVLLLLFPNARECGHAPSLKEKLIIRGSLSQLLGLEFNLFPSKSVIFRASLKGRLTLNGQIPNQIRRS